MFSICRAKRRVSNNQITILPKGQLSVILLLLTTHGGFSIFHNDSNYIFDL